MGANSERARGARGKEGGWGSLFFGETPGGGALLAQFRRDCPPDVPLRSGTGHGEWGYKREVGRRRRRTEGEAMLNPLSTRDALSPHSSLLLQSGYLLDPQGCLSAALHTNSPLAHSLEHEQRTKSD